jgi:DNA polymerase
MIVSNALFDLSGRDFMRTEDQLVNLDKEIRECKKCILAETRINAIRGEGNPHAKLILIAQAPGETEDREDRMFIGPSGKVLDELLRTIQIDREEIYMTNLVKCMLPKYRKPKSDEIEICSQYLDREIELINPRILASLGYYATKYLFKKYDFPLPPRQEFQKVYGKVLEADDKLIIPVQHPAALLYNSSIKTVMLNNYRKMQAVLSGS